ncbi:hypothetical protein F4802DRAFT_572072 [Xylaria palmicola]|nr:hypothetical protein F4802DRAFT_572072 [Xylaria palmicola]
MTMEDISVGWQASPGQRGTIAIIENCLFTIFACTWTIQHLNVPRLDEGWWPALLHKCKWTMFALFFPEFLMARAIVEFATAVEDMRLLDKKGLLDDNPPWFYQQLWKCSRKLGDEETGANESSSVPKDVNGPEVKWSFTHCYFANMGGFIVRSEADSSHKYYSLTARHFVNNWEHIKIPRLSEEDIQDKSKTDLFARLTAIFQIGQLVLSLIVRQVRRFAFSQLETLTLAFAIFGVLTYLCSWYKPQNVKRPIKISLHPSGEGLRRGVQNHTVDSLWRIVINSRARNDAWSLDRIPNDSVPRARQNETHYALWVLAALTAAFGSIHAISWNSEFPTFAEQLLWRVATLISVALPPAALIVIPLSQITVQWGDSSSFRYTCLDVMRECSWGAADNKQVQAGMKTLKEVCNHERSDMHYTDILGKSSDSEDSLAKKLLEYIQKEERVQECLPAGFLDKLKLLVRIIEEPSTPKRLFEAARTNTYPQRSLFDTWINNGIIYVTGIIYCLARLSIIGLAFSSLRWMPDSVYLTTWTQYIPSVQ